MIYLNDAGNPLIFNRNFTYLFRDTWPSLSAIPNDLLSRKYFLVHFTFVNSTQPFGTFFRSRTSRFYSRTPKKSSLDFGFSRNSFLRATPGFSHVNQFRSPRRRCLQPRIVSFSIYATFDKSRFCAPIEFCAKFLPILSQLWHWKLRLSLSFWIPYHKWNKTQFLAIPSRFAMTFTHHSSNSNEASEERRKRFCVRRQIDDWKVFSHNVTQKRLFGSAQGVALSLSEKSNFLRGEKKNSKNYFFQLSLNKQKSLFCFANFDLWASRVLALSE